MAQDIEDVELEPSLSVLRKYACDDGSGSFTALLPGVRSEHSGIGAWKIVAGTGRYETLRGVGTYTGELVSGDVNDFPTIVFRTTWQGVVDFDAVPPTFTATARARKIRRPRTYTIRTAIDGHESNIRYSVDVRAGKRYLALRAGGSSTGTVTVRFAKIRVPRKTRKVNVIVRVADAVGNESAMTLVVKLR